MKANQLKKVSNIIWISIFILTSCSENNIEYNAKESNGKNLNGVLIKNIVKTAEFDSKENIYYSIKFVDLSADHLAYIKDSLNLKEREKYINEFDFLDEFNKRRLKIINLDTISKIDLCTSSYELNVIINSDFGEKHLSANCILIKSLSKPILFEKSNIAVIGVYGGCPFPCAYCLIFKKHKDKWSYSSTLKLPL